MTLLGKMKRISVLGAATVLAAAGIFASRTLNPKILHQTIVSPDGSRNVAFFKQHVPPYIEGVEITAAYRRPDGTIIREVIANEDLWADFDVYSRHEWRTPTSLVLGSPEGFTSRQTGTIKLVNSTGSMIGIVSLNAGGQKILVLDLAPAEEREIKFPLSSDLEWISAHFSPKGRLFRAYHGTNFVTRGSSKKQSVFEVKLSQSDVRIENSDFQVWKP